MSKRKRKTRPRRTATPLHRPSTGGAPLSASRAATLAIVVGLLALVAAVATRHRLLPVRFGAPVFMALGVTGSSLMIAGFVLGRGRR